MALLTANERSGILEAAVLAPSADNRHCFKLSVLHDRILLFGSQAYVSAPFHRKILSLISFGAVAENVRIRGASLGYQVDASWWPDAEDPALIAELRLSPGVRSESTLDRAIPRRHTNRRIMFFGPALSEMELTRFAECVNGIDGVTLTFMDSVSDRAKLLRLLRVAETERFNSQSLHQDLFSSIRFDVGWHATAEEGLPPGALSVEPGARWAFRQLAAWPAMNMLRRIGLHHALGFRAAYLPCRLAPHCAVLTTSLPSDRGAPLVGVALQRLWLGAETRGLAFQPFAAPALLALPQYLDVPAATRARLQKGWRELSPDTPMMVFRMGLAKRPLVRSGRQAPETRLRLHA